MKLFISFLILFLLSFGVKAQVGRDYVSMVNLQWFTGPTDGVRDVSSAWGAAVNYAASLHRTLYIPAGTYNLAGSGDLAAINALTGALAIEGDGKLSVLLVPGKTAIVLDVFNSSISSLSIKHINFLSTHDTTSIGNAAILLQGYTSNALIRDVTIQDCIFKGFSQAIVGKGVQGADISGNIFLAPLGHDNGTTTTDPDVYVRAIDDSIGDLNRNWRIHDNYADGYSGTGPITGLKTGGPKDGFFHGHVSGVFIYNNQLFRFSQEAVLLQPQLNIVDTAVCIVQGNSINEYIPTGSKDPLGNIIRNNYAIRADAQHVRVINNTIVGATFAIWIDATPYNFQFVSPIVQGNSISFTADPTMIVAVGIYLRGFSDGVRSKGAIVKGNSLLLQNITLNNTFYGIAVTFYDSCQIDMNTVSTSNLVEVGGGTRGIELVSSTGNYINLMVGVDTAIHTSSATYTNIY